MVGQQPGPRPDLDDRPHQPREEIDAVDGLDHQRPAAIEFPGAAPGAAVIIILGAMPLYDGVAERKPAEAATVDRPLQFQARLVEP